MNKWSTTVKYSTPLYIHRMDSEFRNKVTHTKTFSDTYCILYNYEDWLQPLLIKTMICCTSYHISPQCKAIVSIYKNNHVHTYSSYSIPYLLTSADKQYEYHSNKVSTNINNKCIQKLHALISLANTLWHIKKNKHSQTNLRGHQNWPQNIPPKAHYYNNISYLLH